MFWSLLGTTLILISRAGPAPISDTSIGHLHLLSTQRSQALSGGLWEYR
jgi:hypothetical protein